MKKICYIVAASDAEGMFIEKAEGDYIIAADAGLSHLEKQNITPDIVLGDFDSYGKIPTRGDAVILPCEKDDTDTAVALSKGYEAGYRLFVIYGGLGNRTDHTLANIQSCTAYAKKGCTLCLWGMGESIYFFDSSCLSFDFKEKGTVSVFTDSVAYGVTIEGLKYTLNDYEMRNTFPIGVSNEFIGENSIIKANKGTLIVVKNEDAKVMVRRLKHD